MHGFGMRTSRDPAQRPQQRRLKQQQATNQPGHQVSLLSEETKIDGHAHTHEEQPKQQTTKGLDVGHDLVAVAGISQQQAAEKGTKGHGQAGPLREPCGTEHQQYAGGGEYLRIPPASGNKLQHGPQEDAAEDEDSGYSSANSDSRAVSNTVETTGCVTRRSTVMA